MVTVVEALPVIIPSVALGFAILNTLLVVRAFRRQPWNIKQWLFLFIGGWIPWAGFTVLMRVATDHDTALWYLRGSFISLQLLSYALYKFHHLLVFQDTQNRFSAFGMAILMGFNIAASFNVDMMDVQLTPSGLYWVDNFSTLLLLSNLTINGWAAYWGVRALRRQGIFSRFYNPDGSRKTIQMTLAVILPGLLPVLFGVWMLQQNSDVAPDVTLFIILSIPITTFVGYIYGLRPMSTMLSPQRLWSIFLINSAGLPIYEKHFSHQQRIGDLALFAGALNATNTIFQHELKSSTSLSNIVFEDRAVMIRTYQEYLLCLVADHQSRQLDNVLDELLTQISQLPGIVDELDTRSGEVVGSTLLDRIIEEMMVVGGN